MRLLQLATGDGELIDLHPNVTVVAGLAEPGRQLLTEAVLGLARGEATGPTGLLEAHGVLFDFVTELLELLDVEPGDVRPIVTAADLPTIRRDPRARERTAAERHLAEVEERWATAGEARFRADAAVAASTQALERAQRAAEAAASDATSRIQSIDSLTSSLDHAVEQRRRLEEELSALAPRVERATRERAEVETRTEAVRAQRQVAAVRGSDLAAQVEAARMSLDPGAVADAERAAAELAEVEAEVAAERAEEAAQGDAPSEAPADRLERVQQGIDELEKQLAVFGPADIQAVGDALDRVRAAETRELVPSPEAQALADQLAAVESELRAAPSAAGSSEALAGVRSRLDDARHALLVAEQAVRNPELDRALVDRLEHAHADLLDAIDRANSRLGGARAQRRVEKLRDAEVAILDELGFTSYSDYMMGYSLLHVDPEKEAALDAARNELADAEDAWEALEAETESELARAELVERRRLLLEQAGSLVAPAALSENAIEHLRTLRVEAQPGVDVADALRQALDAAGVALGDEDIDRDDLLLVGEAWLAEAADATIREEEVWADLKVLAVERAGALADVEAEAARGAIPDEPTPEELRLARLSSAHQLATTSEARRQAHLEAEALVGALSDELAVAAELERTAAEASAEADAVVAAAIAHEEGSLAELGRVEGQLAAAIAAEGEGSEQLRALSDPEATSSPEELVADLERAEAALVADQQAAEAAAGAVTELDEERRQAADAAAALQGTGVETVAGTSLAEEVEWYLLARLAAQRSVSLGGSLPLVLDDALAGLDEGELNHVLGRLERMAEAVQVIVVSDDPLATSWALLAGADRAAVVHPGPG